MNNQAIYKLQYTKSLGSNALFKVYGYTYYSNWIQNGPQTTYADYVGCCSPDYELSSHTRGISGTFTDQLGSKNLVSLEGSATTATTTRDNNTQMINGLYASGERTTRVRSSARWSMRRIPTAGCATPRRGAPTTCSFSGHGAIRDDRRSASGAIAPVPAGERHVRRRTLHLPRHGQRSRTRRTIRSSRTSTPAR